MMTIRRVKQFQSVLHFNSNLTEENGKDALHKTRPLLNILKKTIGVFLIPRSELSLDEASCASRSSYGRELIFSIQPRIMASSIFVFIFYVTH
jgi:hypothetical protein